MWCCQWNPGFPATNHITTTPQVRFSRSPIFPAVPQLDDGIPPTHKATPEGAKNSCQSFGLVHFLVFTRWYKKYRFPNNDKIQWSNCSLPVVARILRDCSEHILFFLNHLLLVFVTAVIQQGFYYDPFKTVLTILCLSVSLSPCISAFLCFSRLQYLII